jgi:hypothetical protein
MLEEPYRMLKKSKGRMVDKRIWGFVIVDFEKNQEPVATVFYFAPDG